MRKRNPLTEEQRAKKRERDRISYIQNKEKRKEVSRKSRLKHLAKRRDYDSLPEVKKRRRENNEPKRQARIQMNNQECLRRLSNGCIECGELDILVLEFDHPDDVIKTKGISQIRKNGLLKDLIIELDKCVVLCANCHRRRTAKQFGSWRLNYAVSTL